MQPYFELRHRFNLSASIAKCSFLSELDITDLQSGKIKPQGLVFKVRKGFERFDFLQTGFLGILLCSQKVVDLFQSHDVKGWSATKVELAIGKEAINSSYYIFQIPGTSGPFNYKQSEVTDQFGHSFIELKGRFFDESLIDGLDIFIIQNTWMIFVTERLHTLITQAKLTNIIFTRNDEYTGSIPLSLYRQSIEGK